MPDELPLAVWSCAVCGETNESPVDPSLGATQKFTDDCRVCCHPNLLRIVVHGPDDLDVRAEFDE